MATKPAKASAEKSADAIALLSADHKAVKALFNEFEKLIARKDADEEKAAVVRMICDALSIHAQVEEEIFYPAVRSAIADDDLLDEAEVEHATARDLIAQLREMSPGDDLYDAKVTVLSEYIDHHVNEEEGELFPKARAADLDTTVLGAQMAKRKEELKSDAEIDGSEFPPPRRKTANGSGRAAAK